MQPAGRLGPDELALRGALGQRRDGIGPVGAERGHEAVVGRVRLRDRVRREVRKQSPERGRPGRGVGRRPRAAPPARRRIAWRRRGGGGVEAAASATATFEAGPPRRRDAPPRNIRVTAVAPPRPGRGMPRQPRRRPRPGRETSPRLPVVRGPRPRPQKKSRSRARKKKTRTARGLLDVVDGLAVQEPERVAGARGRRGRDERGPVAPRERREFRGPAW